jgi:glycosyltransferase involved in cell wall biosynthesis
MRDYIKMQLKNKKILFLYTGGHSVHLAFAKAIGADIRKLSKRIPKDYDIYITEANFLKLALLKFLGKFKKNAKIINLFADPRMYYLNKGIYFEPKKNKVKKYPYWKKKITIFLLKKLDGVLCVGNLVRSLFHNLIKKVPSKVVYSFISDERLKNLNKIKPSLSKKEIIFIGSGPDWHYKGIDLLLKSFKILKKEFPELKVRIIGDWKNISNIKIKDFHFEGIQKDLKKYLKSSSLMVHMGRGDTFPVSTIESMNAGIPVMISKDTGTKEIVEKVRKDFVLDLNPKKISKKIKEYFELKLSEKKKISNSFRKEGKKFNEKDMLKVFEKQFKDLIKEI